MNNSYKFRKTYLIICLIIIYFFSACKRNEANKIFDNQYKLSGTKQDSTYDNDKLKENDFLYLLGDTKITLKLYEKHDSLNIVFFNMHDNEKTCISACKEYFKTYGGKLLEINAQGKREISFSLKGNTYSVDPNRIFTNSGLKKTLNNYGNYTEDGFLIVKAFVDSITGKYFSDRNQIVVALHNNTDGNYSIRSYQKGGELERDASEVYINNNNDPDDFFFVTDIDLFNEYKSYGFNVALQNNENVTDDGSFSVFCGNYKKPYINVEAQAGHLKQQIEMLNKTYKVIEKVFYMK